MFTKTSHPCPWKKFQNNTAADNLAKDSMENSTESEYNDNREYIERVQKFLKPHENRWDYVQSVLLWEKPSHSLAYFIAMTALVGLMASGKFRVALLLIEVMSSSLLMEDIRSKVWQIVQGGFDAVSDKDSRQTTLSFHRLCTRLALIWTTFVAWHEKLNKLKTDSTYKFYAALFGLLLVTVFAYQYLPLVPMFYVTVCALYFWPVIKHNGIHRTVTKGLRNLLFGKEKGFLATVAIDLGTTYSGFASSLNKEQDESSLIFMNKDWVNGQGHRTSKTPTCLLLKPDQAFDSFGYEAVERYAYLRSVYEVEANEFFFFELFKMTVYNDQILELESTLLEASNGRALKAITVFAHCIKFLRNEALKVIRRETGDENCGVKDILWVLSVPVMWKARSKQFMREAAYEAGIGSRGNPGQVMILTEAEAAAHFCVKTRIKEGIPSETRPEMQDKASTPFLLADIGGGRLDMVVYQQHGDDSIEEIYKETSDAYGADMISIMISELFGAQLLNDYRVLFPSDWLKIRQEFEAKKHDFQNGETTLRLPGSFVASVNDFRSPPMKKYAKGEVKILDDEYLCLSASVMLKLLWPLTKFVKHNLRALLSKPQLSKVKTILLVGGCSNSLLQKQIQNMFAGKYYVTVPPDAPDVVVKGAVMVALTTAATKRRVVGTSYGAACSRNFVRGKHPEVKKFLFDGEEKCRDLFTCFVKGTDTVKHGQKISVRYRPREANETEMRCKFYATAASDAVFVTDPGLIEIGSLLVQSPDTRQGLDRDVLVSMYFGGTEIIATAWDVTSGNRAQTTLDVSGLTRSISMPGL